MPIASFGLTPPSFSSSTRDLLHTPHLFFLKLTQDYGDVVQYRAAPEPAYLLNHPDFARHVLVQNGRYYSKDTHLNKYMLQALTGAGLLTSENPLWRRQRRLMQPAFHQRHLVTFGDLITQATATMLERWWTYACEGTAFDVAHEMMQLTLEIVTGALFSYDVRLQADAIGTAVSTLINNPKPRRRIFQQSLQVLDEIVYGIINQRRAQPEEGRYDLLDMLLQARYEDTGDGMADKQIRDEVMSLLVAGHETTANTLSWLWYLLGQHIEVVAKMETEIDGVLNGRFPTPPDIAHLCYTNQVVKESMRLYPSAWSISRRALINDLIGGYHIPAQSVVAISPYTLHRHPAFWPNPEQFDPDRFTPEQEAARHRYAYLPFGAGMRKCIGDQFALMESMMIVPMVLQRYRLSLVPDHPVEGHALITLRPRYGIHITIQPR